MLDRLKMWHACGEGERVDTSRGEKKRGPRSSRSLNSAPVVRIYNTKPDERNCRKERGNPRSKPPDACVKWLTWPGSGMGG